MQWSVKGAFTKTKHPQLSEQLTSAPKTTTLHLNYELVIILSSYRGSQKELGRCPEENDDKYPDCSNF
ncbi:hypothetical protein H6G33_05060 [Calothrix sp. FACHB-1219]|uniref:hypothetical protein n=1 Tax=unclassified Calothrix TaxID=2619626 RepID=UPI001686113D|nr:MULTISPECIES: hypothetical protein [unclassified Calothrix]MBD2216396.1 hypothetical protein [Calothrix sp. FACHB-1219]